MKIQTKVSKIPLDLTSEVELKLFEAVCDQGEVVEIIVDHNDDPKEVLDNYNVIIQNNHPVRIVMSAFSIADTKGAKLLTALAGEGIMVDVQPAKTVMFFPQYAQIADAFGRASGLAKNEEVKQYYHRLFKRTINEVRKEYYGEDSGNWYTVIAKPFMPEMDR